MVSRRRGATEEVLTGIPAAEMSARATGLMIVLLLCSTPAVSPLFRQNSTKGRRNAMQPARMLPATAILAISLMASLRRYPAWCNTPPRKPASRGRAPLYLELRGGRRRRHLALVAGRERRQVDGFRRQPLPDQARPGLDAVGHRIGRRHRRHARGSAAGGSAHDPLAAAEDARLAARGTRRQTGRHQIRRRLAHPSRPYRQCRHVPAEHAAGPEGRVRLALAGRSALQAGPSRHQARR